MKIPSNYRKEMAKQRYARTVERAQAMRKELNGLGFLLRRVFDMNLESPSDNFDESEAEYDLLQDTQCTKIHGGESRFIITMKNGCQYKVTVEEL